MCKSAIQWAMQAGLWKEGMTSSWSVKIFYDNHNRYPNICINVSTHSCFPEYIRAINVPTGHRCDANSQ